MNLYSKSVQQYLEAHTQSLSPELKELERRTFLEMLMPQMISGHVQGNFLTMICKLISAKSVLELGTFTGYGTICLAKGIPDEGQIITVEQKPEFVDIANEFWKRSNVDHKITQHIGEITKIVPSINDTFDLVFIDAGKKFYWEYFELVFPKVKKGGLILADNVMWSGKVLEEKQDAMSKKLAAFNKLITEDPRVENVIMPLRDGIHFIRKI